MSPEDQQYAKDEEDPNSMRLKQTAADFTKLSLSNKNGGDENRNNGSSGLIMPDGSDVLRSSPQAPAQAQDDHELTVPIDTKTLYDPNFHLPDKPDFNDPTLGYEAATPLSDELIQLIALK
jgi:hypothetical protein